MSDSSRLYNELDPAQLLKIQQLKQQLKSTWNPEKLGLLVGELNTDEVSFLPTLVELVKVDMEKSWAANHRILVDDYLSKFPVLVGHQKAVLDLLQAEYEIRQLQDSIQLVEYQERFPDLYDALLAETGKAGDQNTKSFSATTDLPGLSRNIGTNKSVDSSSDSNDQPTATLNQGQQFGRYRILRTLGVGGMGTVFLAEDSKLDRQVAIKVPKFTEQGNSTLVERFFREARLAAKIDHPNICPIFDFGEIEGIHFIAMAYIEGQSLAELTSNSRTLNEQFAVKLVHQLALALAAAHETGIIHRDLKPANIMVNRRNEPVIMDFGLARRETGTDPSLTRAGAFVGTPAYVSPEQIRNKRGEVGPLADQYSLGVVLYRLLTGELPFEADDALSMIGVVLADEPTPPLQHNQGLSPELAVICLKTISKNPEHRFRSMKEFADVLKGFLDISAATPTLAPPLDQEDRLSSQPHDNLNSITNKQGSAETFNRDEPTAVNELRIESAHSPAAIPESGHSVGSRDWRELQSASSRAIPVVQTNGPKRKRKSRLWTFLILFGVLAGGFAFCAWLFLAPNSPTNLVVIANPGVPADGWHTNSPGIQKTLERLEELRKHNPALKLVVNPVHPSGDPLDVGVDLDALFDHGNIEPTGPDRNLVVFYFVCPTMYKANEDGKMVPGLLMADAQDDDQLRFVSISRILRKIAHHRFGGDNERVKRLVIIESLRIEPVSSIGVMLDEFPQTVQQVVERLDHPDLMVVLSHDNDQKNWYAPELGSSVFSRYVHLALCGAADGFGNERDENDGQISFLEFASFVQKAVAGWVRQNRNAVQVPQVFHQRVRLENGGAQLKGNFADDFQVVSFDSASLSSIVQSSPFDSRVFENIEDRGVSLNQHWKQLNEYELTHNPIVSARAIAALVRCEQLFDHCSDREFSQAVDQFEYEFAKIRHNNQIRKRFNHSRLTLVGIEKEIVPHRQRELKIVFDDWIELVRKQFNTKDQDRLDELKTKQSELDFRFQRYTRAELAWMFWSGFRQETSLLSRNDLRRALNQLGDSPFGGPDAIEFVEIQFLKLLASHVDWADLGQLARTKETVNLSISCRDLSERLMVDCNPAVFYWLDVDLQQLDQQRRFAEDRLFAGQVELAQQSFQKVLNEIREIHDKSKKISSAIQTRNQCLQELPYLMAWLAREELISGIEWHSEPELSDKSQERYREVVTELLGRLIRLNSDLSPSNTTINWNDKKQLNAAQVKTGFYEIRQGFDMRAAFLVNSAAIDQSVASRAKIFLQYPWLSNDMRRKLRDKYIQSLRATSIDVVPAVEAISLPNSEGNVSCENIQRWIVDLRQQMSGLPLTQRYEQGEFVQDLYSKTWLEIIKLDALSRFAGWTELAIEDTTVTAMVRRNQLWIADFLIRFSASSITEHPRRLSTQPIQLARVATVIESIDRDRHFIRLAGRSLEDFWGDVSVPVRYSAISESPLPYFARLSRHYMRMNQGLKNESEVANFERLYVRYMNSLESLKLEIDSNVRFESPQHSEVKIPNSVKFISQSLPDGTLAITTSARQNVDHVISMAKRDSPELIQRKIPVESFDLQETPKIVDFSVSSLDVETIRVGGRYRVRTSISFRGHMIGANWTLHASELVPANNSYVQTKIETIKSTPPIVQVTGRGRGTTDVMFIIDCSESMRVKVDDQSERIGLSRMDVAKSTLRLILENLKGNKELRIGLTAFGHSVYWDRENEKRVYVNEAEKIRNGEKLILNNDVEILHPLKPGVSFSRQGEYDEIIREYLSTDQADPKSSRLQPRGVTPLYRSILTAAKHLQDERINNNVPQQIIVLTDGANYQWEHESDNKFLFDGLYKNGSWAPELNGVNVFIVGYQFQGGSANENSNLNKLVEKTGGAEFYTDQIEDLRAKLEETVKIVRFGVTRDHEDQLSKSDLIDLGAQWQSAQQPFIPGIRWVKIIDKDEKTLPLYLYGGEFVKINYAANRSLEIEKNDLTIRGTSQSITMGEGSSESQYEVGRLFAQPHGRFSSFKFVIRNQDHQKQTSYRPQALFLEIIPKDGDPSRIQRVLDYIYLPNFSVPVIKFADAELEKGSYTLRLWYVPFQNKSDLSNHIPVQQGQEKHTIGERKISIVRTASQVIVTTVGGEQESLRRLWVQMDQAKSVNRKFFISEAKVEHTFELGNVGDNQPAKLWIREFDKVFGTTNFIEFQYEHQR